MTGIWRAEVVARLVGLLSSRGPSLVLVRGVEGSGRSTVVREAIRAPFPADRRPCVVAFTAPPLPDADRRALLAERFAEAGLTCGEGPAPPGWGELFASLERAAEETRRAHVLVLDDAHLLLDGAGEATEELLALWKALRARALPVHLVLTAPERLLRRSLGRSWEAVAEALTHTIELSPLDARDVARLVPDWSPRDRLRAWAIFGGLPARLRHLEPSRSLAHNVQHLLLAEGAPLGRAGLLPLERELQSLPRYASLLAALAGGAREWGELKEATPALGSGSAMAPYIARLEEMGMVEARRSLDAAPGGRSRRYELTDPFPAFWYRFVLPSRTRLLDPDPATAWKEGVRPDLDAHLALHFPEACRRWLARHGDEVLPARARLVGGLWGSGYDLDVSGTLTNGQVVYGTARWVAAPVGDEVVRGVGEELRATRYGFGREGRHRVVFSGSGFTPSATRLAARDRFAHAIGFEALVTDPGTPPSGEG